MSDFWRDLSSVAVNTSYGPVFSFWFLVTQPHDSNKSFTILGKPLDISKPQQIQPWKKLANQTHIHLLLVDANCDVQGFYEFENDSGIGEAVETILQLDADRVVDFREAQQEYFAEYSLVDLYEAVKNNA